MSFWILAALLTGGMAVWLLHPLLAPEPATPPAMPEDALVAELRRARTEAAAGRLPADALAEVEREIARRALRASRTPAAPLRPLTPRARRLWSLTVIAVLLGTALGLYPLLGRPDLPDRPLAERTEALAAMADSLAARLARDPQDPEAWLRLARARQAQGNAFAAENAALSAVRFAAPAQREEIARKAQAFKKDEGTPGAPSSSPR